MIQLELVNSSFRRIQNSKFKIQNLRIDEFLRKQCQKLDSLYFFDLVFRQSSQQTKGKSCANLLVSGKW